MLVIQMLLPRFLVLEVLLLFHFLAHQSARACLSSKDDFWGKARDAQLTAMQSRADEYVSNVEECSVDLEMERDWQNLRKSHTSVLCEYFLNIKITRRKQFSNTRKWS
jgi:hypothetical protein